MISKINVKSFIALVFIMFLSGCAGVGGGAGFQEQPINYQIPTDLKKHSSSNHNATITIGKIADNRVGNHRLYGTYSLLLSCPVQLIAEDELSIIIQRALDQALKKQGYAIVEKDSKYVLAGELLTYDLDGSGWNTVTSKLELKLQLIDVSARKIIWQEVMTGKALDHENISTDKAERKIYESLFCRALDNVIHQLNNSKTFREQIVKDA